MKAKITSNTTKTKGSYYYPVLMCPPAEEETDLLVFFVNADEGYRIKDGQVGTYLEGWMIPATDKYWTKFEGTVEFSN